MGEKKKTSAVYARLVKFMAKREVRITCVGIALLLSLLMMFLLDDYNVIRDKYLSFLNDNFFDDLLVFLRLEPFNAMMNAWIIFLGAFITILVFVIAAYSEKAFVNKRVEKNSELFKKKRVAEVFYKVEYYLIVAAICSLIIFVVYMFGAFDQVKGAGKEVYMNLLYIASLCLMFVVLIPLIVVLIFFILHLILKFCGWVAFAVSQFKRDVEAHAELEETYRKKKFEGFGGGLGGGGEVTTKKGEKAGEIFPSLMQIDRDYAELEAAKAEKAANADAADDAARVTPLSITLEEFALQFQAYAASRKIYYELPTIRSFIAGLATTRFIVLQGVSGTGKSMLPRMFGEFVNSAAFFAPVQATWRDKTDLLGFYSEFTKKFKSTDFLKDLYEASYKDGVNMMVLDEMNISRIEYYFADFLSILEYPSSDWLVNIIEPDEDTILPAKLDNGYVRIPTNTWIIGTANTDDSTYTITDKVYDRAIVLTFEDKFSPFKCEREASPINIDAETFSQLLEAAQNDEDKRLTDNDINRFLKICNYVNEAFDLFFGNRIMVQIENFVPVYVALGGTKEEALDFMFARKILRKLDNSFDDYMKENLIGLLKLLDATYGKGIFKETEKSITKLLKRLV